MFKFISVHFLLVIVHSGSFKFIRPCSSWFIYKQLLFVHVHYDSFSCRLNSFSTFFVFLHIWSYFLLNKDIGLQICYDPDIFHVQRQFPELSIKWERETTKNVYEPFYFIDSSCWYLFALDFFHYYFFIVIVIQQQKKHNNS